MLSQILEALSNTKIFEFGFLKFLKEIEGINLRERDGYRNFFFNIKIVDPS